MSQKPNIVFCHLDQLSHNTLGAKGDPNVRTPNIDRIRADGMSFDLAQGSYPVCCPARASWYTGRMPSENGVWTNGVPVREELPDLGQWLGTRGYDCYYAGKWHVPGRDQADSFTEIYPHRPYGEKDDPHIAQVAAALVERRDADKPYFLNVGFQNPHDICYTAFGKDRPATKLGMEAVLEDDLPPLPPTYDPAEPVPGARGWGPEQVRLHNYYYYRMIEMADRELGRLYDAVLASPERENTVFVLTSDHGEFMGYRNRFRKGLAYDQALRVPLTVVWPGRATPGSIDATHCANGVDVTATLLEIAGAEAMPGMTVARSLVPLIDGEPIEWREYTPAETQYGGLQQIFRDDRYKSLFNFQHGFVELYDYRADPNETKDLAKDPAHAEALARHRGYLRDYNENQIEWSQAYADEMRRRNCDVTQFYG